ncbi:MAG: hypothetical protein JJD96_03165 [Thermoleophilia bacterium]|nr:hypothetical protein [Thermoleophilia bacterium]
MPSGSGSGILGKKQNPGEDAEQHGDEAENEKRRSFGLVADNQSTEKNRDSENNLDCGHYRGAVTLAAIGYHQYLPLFTRWELHSFLLSNRLDVSLCLLTYFAALLFFLLAA